MLLASVSCPTETCTLLSHPLTPQEGNGFEPSDQAWVHLILSEADKLDIRIGRPPQTPGATSPTLVLNQNWLGFSHWLAVLSQSLSGGVFTAGIVLETRKLMEGKGRVQGWCEPAGMSHAGNRHKRMESTWNGACL